MGNFASNHDSTDNKTSHNIGDSLQRRFSFKRVRNKEQVM